MRKALEAHSFRKASSEKGDARPVRENRDADAGLPAELAPLLRSREAWIVDFGSKEGRLLELTTDDDKRVARLGAGDARGVRSDGAVAVYDVQQAGSELRLVLRDGEPSEGRPGVLTLAQDQGRLHLRMADTSTPVEVRRVVREGRCGPRSERRTTRSR